MTSPRPRAPVLAAIVTSAVSALLLAGGCQAPTQLTIALEVRGFTCQELREVAIVVGEMPALLDERASRAEWTSVTVSCTGTSVGTLVVTPGPSERGAVMVLAGIDRPASRCVAPGYYGCIVARRVFTFASHVALSMRVLLEADCKDVPCDALSTCRRGACVSSTAICTSDNRCDDFGRLEDGGAAVVDAPGADSAPRDAATEGSGDTLDGAPDSGIAGDGGACAASPLRCPPLNTECLAPNHCYSTDSTLWVCQTTPAMFDASCFSRAQCNGRACCFHPVGMSAVLDCSNAVLSCTQGGVIACLADCDCPAPTTCSRAPGAGFGTCN